jgi:hypothetical protein
MVKSEFLMVITYIPISVAESIIFLMSKNAFFHALRQTRHPQLPEGQVHAEWPSQADQPKIFWYVSG